MCQCGGERGQLEWENVNIGREGRRRGNGWEGDIERLKLKKTEGVRSRSKRKS